MITITTTDALAEFCERAARAPYVTIDTEFLRERTYYSKLCLVQLAFPGNGADDAVLVDPLAGDLSLDPLYALMRDTGVVKVFHAARSGRPVPLPPSRGGRTVRARPRGIRRSPAGA